MLLPLEYEATISPIRSRTSRQRDFQSFANYPSPGEFLVFLLSFFTKEGAAIAGERNIRDEKHEGRASRIPRGNSRRWCSTRFKPSPFYFPIYLSPPCLWRERERRNAARCDLKDPLGTFWSVHPSSKDIAYGQRSESRICISIWEKRNTCVVCKKRKRWKRIIGMANNSHSGI